MNTEPRRFRRGDTSPERPGLVFKRYDEGREVWITPEKLAEQKVKMSATDAVWRKTPKGIAGRKIANQRKNKMPHVQAYQAAYYKQPEVRARYRAKYNSDPKIIAKREASALKKAEREAYLQSPEYLAIRAARCKSWRERNMDKKREYERTKHRTDPNAKIAKNLRTRIGTVLRRQAGAKKTLHTEELIGCSIQALVLHLQSQFTDGMTLEDLMSDQIHVDHVVPCALFDLTKVENQLACFNFRNLKPMWAKDNRAKSDFIEHNGKQVRARELRHIIPFPTQKAA